MRSASRTSPRAQSLDDEASDGGPFCGGATECIAAARMLIRAYCGDVQLTRFSLLILTSLAACGGGKQDAKAPSSSDSDPSKGVDRAGGDGARWALDAGRRRRSRDESTGTEVAFAGPLRLESLSKKSPPKLDGVVKEWHARSPAKETIAGNVDGLGLDVAVQGGDDTLWLAAEITDSKLVRSPKYADNEDHVTMVLAFPSGRGALKAYEIGVWPGVPGNSPGAVKWVSGPNAGQKVSSAKIVENDGKDGTAFEATIPWSSFAEAATTRVGMRAAFRYNDDGGGILASSPGGVDKPNDLLCATDRGRRRGRRGPTAAEGSRRHWKPTIDVYADISGDERKERISVFGQFFTICGPGYRSGKQFFWRQVAGDIVSLATSSTLLDRKKEELVVQRRITAGNAAHEVMEIWSIDGRKRGMQGVSPCGEKPATVFAQGGRDRIAEPKDEEGRRRSEARDEAVRDRDRTRGRLGREQLRPAARRRRRRADALAVGHGEIARLQDR